MTTSNSPTADISVTLPLVRQLISAQHPDLTDLALEYLGEGWDNVQFRLGPDLVVRLPRRDAAVALIHNEQTWLPVLAKGLSLPIPTPDRIGHPSPDFPYPWSICPWFEGTDAWATPVRSSPVAGLQVTEFLQSLHQPAPDSAPINPHRGIALPERDDRMVTAIDQASAAGRLEQHGEAGVRQLWREAVAAPQHSAAPVWLHGDLHPGNIVVAGDRIVAIIDWGDITSGDPACDLALLWRMFDTHRRAEVLGHLDLDDATTLRARGWALTIGVMLLVQSDDRPDYLELGHLSIREALAEP